MHSETADKPTVLLADDSRVIRKTIIKMLGDGFRIIEAENGQSAWATLSRDSSVDILVTDIDMPEMDGYSLMCRIRATEDEGLQNLPIVVITGAEDEITKERAYACGANDFILKPISPEQIMECVSQHIQGYEELVKSSAPVAEEKTQHSLPSSMPDLESALRILRSPKAASLDSHVLNITLRIMPVLDYANRRFGLQLDHEILKLKKRILSAR